MLGLIVVGALVASLITATIMNRDFQVKLDAQYRDQPGAQLTSLNFKKLKLPDYSPESNAVTVTRGTNTEEGFQNF